MKVFKSTLFVMALFWSSLQLWISITNAHQHQLFDQTVTVAELSMLVYLCVVAIGLIVVIGMLRSLRCENQVERLKALVKLVARREVFLASTVSLVPQTHISASTTVESGVPIRALVQPGVAIAMITQLIRRQREIFAGDHHGHRLTSDSARKVYELRQYAVEASQCGVVDAEILAEKVNVQLDNVLKFEPAPTTVVTEWDVVIRMYGCPTVEGRNGERAQFAKSRSVEVLAWLSMNRERPRRSAVRTAIWDVEISDASFSTVMSDIRRGVSCVAPTWNRKDILPPTFSDSIDLGIVLLSDFDLLREALAEFRQDSSTYLQLARELSLIRDMPFAGVNYMWADLDGTTTRMVLLALEASCELARWARDNNQIDLCITAVKAGLRVMPGDEELLEIQHSFISQRPMSSR